MRDTVSASKSNRNEKLFVCVYKVMKELNTAKGLKIKLLKFRKNFEAAFPVIGSDGKDNLRGIASS